MQVNWGKSWEATVPTHGQYPGRKAIWSYHQRMSSSLFYPLISKTKEPKTEMLESLFLYESPIFVFFFFSWGPASTLPQMIYTGISIFFKGALSPY